MKTMNDVVKDRIGQLSLANCEAEVLIADRDIAIAERDERIAALEAEVAALTGLTGKSTKSPASEGS